MGTVVAILSQLFWGVTVGALSGAAVFVAKLFALIAALLAGGLAVFHWRKLRAMLSFKRP